MSRTFPRIKPDATLIECCKAFATLGVHELPVIDPSNGQFIGVISYRDIFILYNREILQAGTLGIKFITRSEEKTRSDYVHVPEGWVVEVVPVTGKLVARSIKELDLRRKYNISIIVIRPLHGIEIESEFRRTGSVIESAGCLDHYRQAPGYPAIQEGNVCILNLLTIGFCVFLDISQPQIR